MSKTVLELNEKKNQYSISKLILTVKKAVKYQMTYLKESNASSVSLNDKNANFFGKD